MSLETTGPPPASGGELLRQRLRQRAGAAQRPEPSIPAAPRDGTLPLSYQQRRLWILDQLRPGGTDYLVPLVLRLRGDLAGLDLAAALTGLVRRHEILRTRYLSGAGGEPAQVIDPPGEVPLPCDDLAGADPAVVDAVVRAAATQPFDLAAGPLLRARLIRTAPREHLLVLATHHIAIDGGSVGQLVADLAALSTGRELPAPDRQYADYAAWQREQLAGERLARGLAYWTGQLRDLPALRLPTDRARPAVWQPAGDTVRFEIGADLAERARAVAREHRATAFMVHLAAFWSLLSRHTGQVDFAVGSPVAGRTHPGTQHLLGLFADLLVLRADLTGDPTFAELVGRARGTALDAYAHQDTPFDAIVNALAPPRDLSVHPLVSANLTWQHHEPVAFSAGPVTGEAVPLPSWSAKVDLGWTLTERPDGGLAGEVTFPHALLDRQTAHRLAERYVRLLAAACAEPGRRVSDLPLLDAAELARLARHRPTATPAAPGLPERFAAQVRRRPDAVAISAGGSRLTYRELDARANRLAHRLRALGVDRERLVGVCLGRSADLVVALLAVLKAGGGYLPLDPDQPPERVEFLVRDAGARLLITESGLRDRLPAGGTWRVLRLDDPAEADRLAALPATTPAVTGWPDQLAYVIYTSGSTGRPKGVQVSHAQVVRLFTATEPEFGFGPDDVWALFHSYAFDFSVWEIWGALLHGGRLVVVPYRQSRSPWDLAELLAGEGVTVLNQTPSAFRGLVELAGRGEPGLDRLRLRLVIFGGEALDVGALAPWWRRFGEAAPRLVNMYGITETTVHVTYRPLARADLAGDRSPIGRPIRDLAGYVLDDRMRPVPAGVPGELYVGGAGVSRGYLGRPGLTADRFVPDPYGPPGSRLYRTGDQVRVLAGGELGFLGRRDDQVKIRGYRIELGEVEAVLAGHPAVAAAAVTVHEPAPGDRQLVGYLVARDGTRPSGSEIRRYAADRLPGHMVPAVLTVVPELPRTATGKVDRRALPSPGGARPDQEPGFAEPRTPAERAMARTWASVLGTTRVGRHDNFFALGGDSIRAVRLVGQLRAQGHDYSVQDLFRHQSIAELTRGGDDSDGGDPGRVEATGTAPFALLSGADRERLPAGLVDAYPMATVQLGMVYELLADPVVNPYHNVTSYLIRDPGEFRPDALATALAAVVARHEILRTSFDLATFSEPLQLVHARATAALAHTDLRGHPASRQQAELAAFRDRERAHLFDLDRAPLIRLHTHQVGDRRWYLTLTECHAVLDGWSHNSVISELLAGYRAVRDGRRPPPAPPTMVRFADFVAQERRSLAEPADRAFWAGRLAGAGRLTIPAAWADPDGPPSYAVPVPFDDLGPALRGLAGRAGASLKSVLLAAHVAVWRAVTGTARGYGALVSNGRIEAEGGDQVRGMFLNPVPFVAPAGAASWRELVAAVFAEEVALWPHRRFPLPRLQRELGGGRLLEVAFNYLDFHVLDREMVDTAGSTDVSPTEFPLAVQAQRAAGALTIVADGRAVGRRHAELLARMYRRALTLLATDPDGSPEVGLLPPAERARLLAAGYGTRAPRPRAAVPELVTAHAEATPDAMAVDGGAAGGTLTYRQLRARAGGWAAALRRSGVRPGDLVGLCLPRAPELIAAMLGALACGAAYVPVDPRHPRERIAGLLRDAGVRVVAADPAVAGALPVPASVPAVVPPVTGGAGAGPERLAPGELAPEELAYVVHTSGSTGQPKGVMVRHGAFADRVASMHRNTGLDRRGVVALVVPVGTDACQLGIFATLAAGGRLLLLDDDLARDPQTLAGALERGGATLMQGSPTTWRMLAESGWSPPPGFQILCGGEPIDPELLRRLRDGGTVVWDMYGPTEATVFCFGTRYPPAAERPAAPAWVVAANTTAYLLDAHLEPVPDGVTGQIYVGGDGLARGYLRRPGATAGAFLPDPHSPTPGSRLYATGDIGRRTPDGRLEVLGRGDQQVKIRGFRVEPGEVEHALARHPRVWAAVVRPVPGPRGDARLAAYVVPRDRTATAADLRQFLAGTLPEHLVPTHWMILDSFPVLPNGKVDRAALPAPDPGRPAPATRYEPPRGPVERAIATVWAEVLGVERVGRDDDFFALGGHSLLTLRIISRLPVEHGIRVSFRDFLRHPTVRDLAAAAEPATTPAGADRPDDGQE